MQLQLLYTTKGLTLKIGIMLYRNNIDANPNSALYSITIRTAFVLYTSTIGTVIQGFLSLHKYRDFLITFAVNEARGRAHALKQSKYENDLHILSIFLFQIGGDNMFSMMYDANFTYDSSMPIYDNAPPPFPYTLDYKMAHDCMIPPCPQKAYPGTFSHRKKNNESINFFLLNSLTFALLF